MECSRCNTGNPEGAKFCASCGASLVLVCAQCGTELLAGMRFCDKCGNPVGAPFDLAQGRPPPAAPDHVADRLQRLVPKEFAERLLAARGKMEVVYLTSVLARCIMISEILTLE